MEIGKDLFWKYIITQVGILRLTATNTHLTAIGFCQHKGQDSNIQSPILEDTENQLDGYFRGLTTTFNLPILPAGTDFQRKVWEIVSSIEYGSTMDYFSVAALTGSEKNTRAVGMANGKNPIPIIIPCHRVIGRDGKLTGYSGGLEIKKWLLLHEKNNSFLKPGLLF